MTPQAAKLVLFSTDAEEVRALNARLPLGCGIVIAHGTAPEVTERFHLDALWSTPLQARSLGVREPLPLHRAGVFVMPQEKRGKGLPGLLIAGVALVPGREYSEEYLATIPAKALAEAVAEYNASHDPVIRTVGSATTSLSLTNSEMAWDALRSAFSEESYCIEAAPSYPRHEVA